MEEIPTVIDVNDGQAPNKTLRFSPSTESPSSKLSEGKRRARRGARRISTVATTIAVECIDGERLWKFLVTPDLMIGDLIRKLKLRIQDRELYTQFCIVHKSEDSCRKLSRTKSVLEMVAKWGPDKSSHILVFCYRPKTADESSSSEGEYGLIRSTSTMDLMAAVRQPSADKIYDKWGFEVNPEQAGEFDDLRDKEKETQRADRWVSMIKNWEHYIRKRPKKVRARFWKGVPYSLRSLAWIKITEVTERIAKSPALWKDSLAKEYDDMEQINKDIGRTFTTHKYFVDAGGPGQRALADVLHAYACYDTKVGYCQGMGFIASLLLVYVSPEETFHIMIRLLQKLRLGGLFENGFPLLFQWFYVLIELMKLYTPKVHAFFEEDMILPDQYASSWFQTLYISILPFGFTVRIWDLLLLGNIGIVFRVAITLLQVLQPKILAEFSAMDAVHYLKKPQLDITADQFIQRVKKCNIPESLIEKLLSQYQHHHRHSS